MYKYISPILFIMLLMACNNDHPTTENNASEQKSESSNTNYAGDKIAFSDLPQNLCELLTEAQVSQFYPEAREVKFDDGKRHVAKNCNFSITIGEKRSDYLIGTILAQEDPSGVDKNQWKETWEFQKMNSESVANLGKAALWFPKKRTLRIKLDSYTLAVTVPGTNFSGEVITKLNGTLKEIAIQIAQQTGIV